MYVCVAMLEHNSLQVY